MNLRYFLLIGMYNTVFKKKPFYELKSVGTNK